jgi:hypothetical protein
MISDRATAEKVEKIMRGVSAQINESIRIVMEGDGANEFQSYRLAAGKVMGEVFLEILTPIYSVHPDLTPPELRQDGKEYHAGN